MLISVYNNFWLHLLSILTNIVSFWYAKKCHFMDIIDRKCQFYVYKLTIMDTGTISSDKPEMAKNLRSLTSQAPRQENHSLTTCENNINFYLVRDYTKNMRSLTSQRLPKI